MRETVTVIGGGLAGSECALQLAERHVDVRLVEQRPGRMTPAHATGALAELVCSNSLKSIRHDSAAGLLKEELGLMGSRLLEQAMVCSVPAGGALAVDRERFSTHVSALVESSPHIEVVREEAREIPDGPVVIAAGPLCSSELFESLSNAVGTESLSFFDAAAPIVDASTIDLETAFSQSRYDDTPGGDYLNCPMDRERYELFWNELVHAERVVLKDFESKDLFQACQPVEEVARTGIDTLRHGALKPMGISDPRDGTRPWAVVQLRAENADATSYNLVGFQTNLTFAEQRRVFRLIPGLEHAEFFRYGVMHRNSFVDSPRALDRSFEIPGTHVRLAGQITGTEGYTEAIASGLMAAVNTYAELRGLPMAELPRTTALGSLLSYATDPETHPYQPMHANFGLMPPLRGARMKKRERYRAYADRGLGDLAAYLATRPDLFRPGEGPGHAAD